VVLSVEVQGLDAVRVRLAAAPEKIQRAAIKRGLLHVAARITETIQESISTPYQPPSDPLSPPHLRTGALRRSVRIESVEPDAVLVAVGGEGTGVPYAVALEYGTSKMLPRPFVAPVIVIAQLEAETIFFDEVDKQISGGEF